MKTAKALGFKKGDWVHYGAWYAKIIGMVHTATPLCFVFGWAEEAGSVYAHDIVKMNVSQQMALEKKHKEQMKSFKAPLVLDNSGN
jgi:malonyl CoA-acyl carrier protein transacylase